MLYFIRIVAYLWILFSTFRVNRGKLLPVEGDTLDRAMLSSNKCYLLDCYSKLYLWMGKTTPSSEKKASITSVEVSFNNPMISILASMPRFRMPLCDCYKYAPKCCCCCCSKTWLSLELPKVTAGSTSMINKMRY